MKKFMTWLGKFTGQIIYTFFYFMPVVGNMIWILDNRKKRTRTDPVSLYDVITMLIRYAAFAWLLYWII